MAQANRSIEIGTGLFVLLGSRRSAS